MNQSSQTQPTALPEAAPVPAAPAEMSSPAPGWPPDTAGTPNPGPVVPTAVRGRSSARFLNWILAGALVLSVGGIAFAVGRMTAPVAAATTRGNFPGAGGGGFTGNGYFGNRGNGNGGFGGFGGALGAGGVTITGTVDSVSATTLTLKLASGQTIQIALDPSTTYHSQTNASASDIVTGGTVQVQLNLGRGGADGGPNASPGTATGPTARDITVVP